MILSILTLMASCQSNAVPGESSHPVSITGGTWKLVKMVSGWTNQETPAEALEYEEYYTFQEDSTFTKYRSNGESATGTYLIGENEDGLYVETFYPEETELRESCTGGKEFLRLEQSGILVGGSLPCDGPALYYEKVEKVVD